MQTIGLYGRLHGGRFFLAAMRMRGVNIVNYGKNRIKHCHGGTTNAGNFLWLVYEMSV